MIAKEFFKASTGFRELSLSSPDGNRLYGPGIAHDKGGIAVILHSLEMLKEVG